MEKFTKEYAERLSNAIASELPNDSEALELYVKSDSMSDHVRAYNKALKALNLPN